MSDDLKMTKRQYCKWIKKLNKVKKMIDDSVKGHLDIKEIAPQDALDKSKDIIIAMREKYNEMKDNLEKVRVFNGFA